MNKQEVGVLFPVKGVDVTCEFGRQPEATAPDAANVRAFEPITRRNRGGSRPGLSKYINETVLGDFPVQHINLLVDPTTDALNAPDGNILPGFIPDPSTNNTFVRNPPGRYIPPRGGFRQPNKNVPSSSSGSSPAFVQLKRSYNLSPSLTQTVTFDNHVGTGNLIVVFVVTTGSDRPTDPFPVGSPIGVSTVRTGGLLDYANVGGGSYAAAQTVPQIGPPAYNAFWLMGMYYIRAASGSSDDSVTVTVGTACNFLVVAMEYNNPATSPLDTFAKTQDVAPANPYLGAQVVANGLKGETVVSGLFINGIVGGTGQNGFSLRHADPDGFFAVLEKRNVQTPGSQTPSLYDSVGALTDTNTMSVTAAFKQP